LLDERATAGDRVTETLDLDVVRHLMLENLRRAKVERTRRAVGIHERFAPSVIHRTIRGLRTHAQFARHSCAIDQPAVDDQEPLEGEIRRQVAGWVSSGLMLNARRTVGERRR
jgi:hypothetical protein